MLTDEELARLKRLDQAATPAPWKERQGYMHGQMVTLDVTDYEENFPPIARLLSSPGYTHGIHPKISDNSALIIEIRNALPKLLAEIDRLKEENQKLLRESQRK